jgi:hypothetical protein
MWQQQKQQALLGDRAAHDTLVESLEGTIQDLQAMKRQIVLHQNSVVPAGKLADDVLVHIFEYCSPTGSRLATQATTYWTGDIEAHVMLAFS